MNNAPADHYTPAKRTLEQVKAFLAKCAKHGSDRSAAKCLLNGNLNEDAMAYVVEYLS